MNKSSHYFPELDSLRFIAFFLVLIHHAPYLTQIKLWDTLHNYGWVGVDIFLCLSAFLFSKLLLAEHQKTGDVKISYFYIRRILRIWPLYFFFTALILIISISEVGWSKEMSIRLIGLLTFTDNILTSFLGYNLILLYVAHIWTISYEEQVYLVIPWLLRFFYRHKAITNWLILIGIALVFSAVRATLIYLNLAHPAIWVLPFTHFESVIGGLVIGLGLLDPILKKVNVWIQLALGIISLYIVTILPNIFLIQWKLMLTYPLVGAGVSLILSSVLQGGLGPLSSWMKQPLPRYLGKISYGLYVYHISILGLLHKLIPKDDSLAYPIINLMLAFVITVLISTISYEFFEKPFQRIKSKFTVIESRSA